MNRTILLEAAADTRLLFADLLEQAGKADVVVSKLDDPGTRLGLIS